MHAIKVRSLALLLVSVALAGRVLPVLAAPIASTNIEWQFASSEADVERAFTSARQQGKPLFLYWGAVWCPPCNQVKATLFSRADFAERSHTFVPVYVDGDRPGAQKVAAHFKVSGYPTMILFRPDGTEIVRLPGEVDPERYLLTLSAALELQSPVDVLMTRALAREPLTSQEWRLLAFHSWDTDDRENFDARRLAFRLSQVSALAPPAVRDRLALKALVARAQDDSGKDDLEASRSAGLVLIERILSSPASLSDQRDLLVPYADILLKFVAPAAEQRSKVSSKWDEALADLLSKVPMTRSEVLDTMDARVELWRATGSSQAITDKQKELVRAECARIVFETVDRYERQSVVPAAAHVLASAGLLAESDALLKGELSHAVSPYYHMLALASNAKQRGDARGALKWYGQAWRESLGPATRLQWGVSYVRELALLAPGDTAGIRDAASSVLSELVPTNETFYDRNLRSLVKFADYLRKWQGHDAYRTRIVWQIQQQLAEKCRSLARGEPGRANCESVFSKRVQVNEKAQ